MQDVDKWCIETFDGGHRWHLGASQIGDGCKRKLWYIFRWCFHDKMKKPNLSHEENVRNRGRMQRLFQRGHREEDRFIEYLEGIGAKVWADDLQNNKLMYFEEVDEYRLVKVGVEDDADETRKSLEIDVSEDVKHIRRAKADGLEFPQFKISAVNGHFGGSLDGIARLPECYGIDEVVLLEFKTNKNGKDFTDLMKKGMAVVKPQHFAQTSTYGSEYGFNFVLYLNANKNNDSLHIELVKLDHAQGEHMKLKAEQIIRSDTPPSRLSDNPTYYACKWCAASEICHKGAVPERNCRSCKFAKPAKNAEWYCEKHYDIIPREFVKKACQYYKAITQNV